MCSAHAPSSLPRSASDLSRRLVACVLTSLALSVALVACSEPYAAEQISIARTGREEVVSTSDTLRLVARWRERCSDGPELPLIKGSVTPSTCSYADFDVSLVCDRPGCSFEVEATGPAEHGYAIDLHTPAEAGPLGIEVTLTHAETGETHTEHLDLELGAPAHYELVCLGHVDHVDPADPTARECATAWPGELRHAGENRITPSFAVVLEARDEAGRALLFSPESSLEGGGSALDRGLVDPCLELFGGRCVGLAGPGTVRFTHHDRVITLVLSADGSVLEREE